VPGLPSGTVTFLFSDVDGSTELVKRLGDRYPTVLGEHRALLRDAFAERGGSAVDTQGDAFFVAFAGALDAVEAAVAGQRALAAHPWPECLKDIERPERLYQLVIEGLSSEFPPLRTLDEQIPLAGTVTVVVVEGRRMLRLHRELTPEDFGELIRAGQQLLSAVLVAAGGREVEVAQDTAMAAFPTASQAARAAVAVQRAVAGHRWPNGRTVRVSIGIHSGEAGVGWVGPAVERCVDLCDAAEGGEIFVSHVTAGLLEEEDLGDLALRDLGERVMRRTGRRVRAHELVFPPEPA
jgi:class 3 adenylate cyclase